MAKFRAFLRNPDLFRTIFFNFSGLLVVIFIQIVKKRVQNVKNYRKSLKMVENGKEIIKQSTFTHMRAHIRVPDYILSPSRRPCLSHLPYNTPLRFKNKYSAFPFPRSHSRRGYISGLFFNMSTLS